VRHGCRIGREAKLVAFGLEWKRVGAWLCSDAAGACGRARGGVVERPERAAERFEGEVERAWACGDAGEGVQPIVSQEWRRDGAGRRSGGPAR
jgi:hypothetical protein